MTLAIVQIAVIVCKTLTQETYFSADGIVSSSAYLVLMIVFFIFIFIFALLSEAEPDRQIDSEMLKRVNPGHPLTLIS